MTVVDALVEVVVAQEYKCHLKRDQLSSVYFSVVSLETEMELLKVVVLVEVAVVLKAILEVILEVTLGIFLVVRVKLLHPPHLLPLSLEDCARLTVSQGSFLKVKTWPIDSCPKLY